MIELPNCTACFLHRSAHHRCLPGVGNLAKAPRILILIDHPNLAEDRSGKPMTGKGPQLIRWMFERMGLDDGAYYLEYIVKCAPPDSKMPKDKAKRQQAIEVCSQYRFATMQIGGFQVVASLGRLACEALTGSSELNKFEGTFWVPSEVVTRAQADVVWIGPNIYAVLMNPSIAGELYRILWAAALQAGYAPVTTNIKPFDWSEFIK